MTAVGIICEYNPFHLGHARQLRIIRETFGVQTPIVCVMSGNYVQRGEPAMWDKYTRARAAVAGGADLVVELPVTSVLQSAEGFARGGVEILSRLGCVDVLCFGTECGDGSLLMDLAAEMDSEEYRYNLQSAIKSGMSYAAARQAALNDQNGVLEKPNNILGLEYCRAIRNLSSSMQPMAIQRTGNYHSLIPDPHAPSATSIRKMVQTGDWLSFLPEETAAVLKDAPTYNLEHGERAMLARLRAMSDDEWEICAHGSEGLWSKAMKAARSNSTIKEITEQVKSKRYPYTRIQRLLMCAYLGITEQNLKQPITYTRLLACSAAGQKLLRTIRKCEEIKVLNPGEPLKDSIPYRQDIRVSDLYTLFGNPSQPCLCKTEQSARLFKKF